MKFILALFSLILLIFFMPDQSWAWGPAAHINLASAVLNNLQVLPGNIQSLLQTYRYDFIYGCISADIITGKKFIEYAKHCHNWHMGIKVLENAQRDSQRAFAYGYLCHLAADVVAHNYYVPNMIIASFRTRTLNHAYWEMRFDSYIDKSVWEIAKKVGSEMHKDNDPLLKQTLDNTLFSFATNKRIFNGMLMMGRLKRWHEAMDAVSARSKWTISEEDISTYEKITLDSMLAFLIDGKKAKCCKADPAGRKSLKAAHEIRKNLKELKRKGKIAEGDYPEIFESLRPKFREATFADFGQLNLKDIMG